MPALGAGATESAVRVRSLATDLSEIWRRFRRNRLAVIGLFLLAFVFLLAALAGIVAPGGPFAMTGQRLQPPSAQHLLGTDNLGRDIFTGVMYGARTSLLAGFLSTLIAVVIGVAVGAVAGFYGGRIGLRIPHICPVCLIDIPLIRKFLKLRLGVSRQKVSESPSGAYEGFTR